MDTIRYIGSKRKLVQTYLDVIKECINKNNLNNVIFADLFAGSGQLSFALSQTSFCKKIVSNDIEYYAYVINYALLNCSYTTKIQGVIDSLNNLADVSSNVGNQLVFSNYANERQYFFPDNARRIDVMRTEIEKMLEQKKITINEHAFLNASILVSADRISNTAGVYTSYLKYMRKESQRKMILTPIHKENKKENQHVVHNTFAENLLDNYDVAYLDPPYNNRQYGACYFPLNFIAQYDKNIKVEGKTGLLPYHKSDFCSKQKVEKSFITLFNQMIRCGAKLVFISYSNEGLLTSDKMKEIFDKFGETEIIETKHRRFQNKKEQENEVSEFLYCIKLNSSSN